MKIMLFISKMFSIKMLIRAAISIVTLVILLIVFNIINPVDKINFFNYPLSKENLQFYKALKKAVKHQKQNIPLKNLTSFNWDKANVYGPYRILDEIPWRSDDCYWTVVFKNKEKVIPIRVSRGLVDIEPLLHKNALKPKGLIYF